MAKATKTQTASCAAPIDRACIGASCRVKSRVVNGMDLPYMNFWTQNLFVCLLLFLPVDFHHRLKCIFSLPVNFLSTKLKYEVKKCIQECIVVGEYWLFVTIIHNRYYFISKQNGIIIINSVFFYFFIIIHPIMIIYY